jgi:hypothetical protein
MIVGGCSNCSNEQQLLCWAKEQNNIYMYSGISTIYNCTKMQKNINYYNLIKSYLPHIKHFKIMPHYNYLDLTTFNHNLIKSFIKEEFIGECLLEYEQYKR